MMDATSRSTPRRAWLVRTLQASIAASVAAIFYPVVRFLWPRRTTVSRAAEVVAPFTVAQLKSLHEKGEAPPPFNFDNKPCLVVLTPDGELRAYNGICTHVACTVTVRPEQGDIFCNCHNGVYDLNGQPVSGPPPRPLQAYKVFRRKTPSGQEEIVVSRST
jgi:Rieske Fe-S protein